MSRHTMLITNGHLKVAATEAGLATSPDFQCQVSSAAIGATPNTQTVPATFCEGESTIAAASGWELVLTWLQDWDVAPPDSLSNFAYANDAASAFFSLAYDATGPVIASGEVTIAAGAYLGDAGVPLTATATWPCKGKPDIAAGTTPAVTQAGPAMYRPAMADTSAA